jgi:hypothetical protein
MTEIEFLDFIILAGQLLPHPLSKPHANRPGDSTHSLSIQSQIRPLGMLSGEAGLSANARFLICGMRDNLELLRMAVHSLFWRDDWQSHVVDVFRTEVDVVLAGQLLFRSEKIRQL